MSKRILSCVLLVFVATFGVVACSSDSDSGDDVGDESSSETETGSAEVEAFCTTADELAAQYADATDAESFDAAETAFASDPEDNLDEQFPDEIDRLNECAGVVTEARDAAAERLDIDAP